MKIFVVNTAILILFEILFLEKLGVRCVRTNNKRPRITYISEPQVYHVAPSEFRDFVIRMTTGRRSNDMTNLPVMSKLSDQSAAVRNPSDQSAVPSISNLAMPKAVRNPSDQSAVPSVSNQFTTQNLFDQSAAVLNPSDQSAVPSISNLAMPKAVLPSDQSAVPSVSNQFTTQNLFDQSAAVLNPSDQSALATQSDQPAKLNEFYHSNMANQFGTSILSDQFAIASQSDQFAIENQSDQPTMPSQTNVQALANIVSSSAIPTLPAIQHFPNYPIFWPQPDHLAKQNLSKHGRMPEWLSHSQNPSVNSVASLTQSKQQPLAYNISFEYPNMPTLSSLTVPNQQKKNWTSEANMQGHKRPIDETEHYITASSAVDNEKDQTESKRVYDIRHIFELSLSALGILPIYINKALAYVIKGSSMELPSVQKQFEMLSKILAKWMPKLSSHGLRKIYWDVKWPKMGHFLAKSSKKFKNRASMFLDTIYSKLIKMRNKA